MRNQSSPQQSVLRWAVHGISWRPSEAEWLYLLKVIGPTEQEKVTKYRWEDDRKRCLISRLLQLACIHRVLGVPWERIVIGQTRGKKPYCISSGVDKSEAPNFNFNVSHEGEYVVLASEPLCLCGVDVAAPQTSRTTRRQTIAQLKDSFSAQLTPEEWTSIRQAGTDEDEQYEAFQQHWGLKEAFVKARGDGLGFDLGRASFTITDEDTCKTARVSVDGKRQPLWRFHLQELGSRHWVSVARGPIEDVVDALKGFTATFGRPRPEPDEYEEALSAPWPKFELVTVLDLLPDHLKGEYTRIC